MKNMLLGLLILTGCPAGDNEVPTPTILGSEARLQPNNGYGARCGIPFEDREFELKGEGLGSVMLVDGVEYVAGTEGYSVHYTYHTSSADYQLWHIFVFDADREWVLERLDGIGCTDRAYEPVVLR